MCEIILKAVDHTHPDPIIDRAGSYKRGYPIAVMEDGHAWGRQESKQVWIAEGNDPAQWHGKTVIVKIPGVPASKARDLIFEQTEDDNGNPITVVDANGDPVPFRRRRWRVLVDNLPAGVIQTLKTDGEITVTVTQVKNYIKRIRDNATFTGMG